MSQSLSITFSRNGSNSTPKQVRLIVKDYLTEKPIPLAHVTVTGPGSYSYTGTAGQDGSINLGTLQPGDYTLVATATGYISSGSDILANDSFTI